MSRSEYLKDLAERIFYGRDVDQSDCDRLSIMARELDAEGADLKPEPFSTEDDLAELLG